MSELKNPLSHIPKKKEKSQEKKKKKNVRQISPKKSISGEASTCPKLKVANGGGSSGDNRGKI